MTIMFVGSENVYTDKVVHYCDVFFPHKLQELIIYADKWRKAIPKNFVH